MVGRGRFSLLILGAVFSAEVVYAEDCPLDENEEHPWLIRITPMKKPSEGNGEESQPEELPLTFSERKNAGENSYSRNKRQGSPGVNLLDMPDKPDSPKNLTNIEGEQSNSSSESEANTQNIIEPGTSLMHGALISLGKILTTAYGNSFSYPSPIQQGEVSLVGYNTGKKCMQEQWAKELLFHKMSHEHGLSTGEFAIFLTHEPFLTEGDPFLFGPSGIPPVPDIRAAYNDLVKKNETTVMMYLFKDKTRKEDGSTHEILSTSFKFIPWSLCQKADIMLNAGDLGLSPRVKAETFFCSNEKIEGQTTGSNYDWYQGSPVLHASEDDRTNIPIGHYIYTISSGSENLHIFATYMTPLSDWLETFPPEGQEAMSVRPDDVEEETTPSTDVKFQRKCY